MFAKGEAASGAGKAGLYAALKGSGATLLTMARSRLELLGVELQEEKARTLRLLLLGLTAVFLAGVAVVLGVILLATLFWEQRVAVFALGTALFALAAFLAVRHLLHTAARPTPVFQSSLAELEADIRALRQMAREAPDEPSRD